MWETIKNAGLWIAEHWSEIVSAFLMIVGALEVIAKWTETDKDDKVVSKMKLWANKINAIVIEIISYITKLHGTK